MFALGGLLRVGSTFFQSAGSLLLPVRTISTGQDGSSKPTVSITSFILEPLPLPTNVLNAFSHKLNLKIRIWRCNHHQSLVFFSRTILCFRILSCIKLYHPILHTDCFKRFNWNWYLLRSFMHQDSRLHFFEALHQSRA